MWKDDGSTLCNEPRITGQYTSRATRRTACSPLGEKHHPARAQEYRVSWVVQILEKAAAHPHGNDYRAKISRPIIGGREFTHERAQQELNSTITLCGESGGIECRERESDSQFMRRTGTAELDDTGVPEAAFPQPDTLMTVTSNCPACGPPPWKASWMKTCRNPITLTPVALVGRSEAPVWS